MFTYTNDERFQVLHGEGSDDWTLQIKYVQKRDNGTYECQVGLHFFFMTKHGTPGEILSGFKVSFRGIFRVLRCAMK
jgi:hypothetical protein